MDGVKRGFVLPSYLVPFLVECCSSFSSREVSLCLHVFFRFCKMLLFLSSPDFSDGKKPVFFLSEKTRRIQKCLPRFLSVFKKNTHNSILLLSAAAAHVLTCAEGSGRRRGKSRRRRRRRRRLHGTQCCLLFRGEMAGGKIAFTLSISLSCVLSPPCGEMCVACLESVKKKSLIA
jgi:hypothetical protein